MNKVTICLFLSLVISLSLCVKVDAINVSVDVITYAQDNNPYLELYSRILSESVEFNLSGDSTLQATVGMTIVLSNGENIVAVDKYNLMSPSSKEKKDFWDLRRIPIKNGEYSLKVSYTDINNPVDTVVYTQELDISFADYFMSTSEILICKGISSEEDYSFFKSGFYYEPLSYNILGPEDDILHFYVETYNSSQREEQRLYYRYFLRENESREQVNKPAYKKLVKDSIVFVLESFGINKVPSGNYSLVYEVVDQERNVIWQEVRDVLISHPVTDYNQRINGDREFATSFVQLLDEGEVNYSLKAIFPRVNNKMSGILNSLIWSDELEAKRYFLYYFWTQFDNNYPKNLYDQYMSVARAVDMEFASNVGHGFESDRGYFFLKYGRPDDIVSVEDEPSAPPYEIWIYNYLEETKQTAVKFLFYNPSIVANDYILLHSTCRGELSNPQWEIELYKEDNFNNTSSRIDDVNADDGFNRNARRYFSDF